MPYLQSKWCLMSMHNYNLMHSCIIISLERRHVILTQELLFGFYHVFLIKDDWPFWGHKGKMQYLLQKRFLLTYRMTMDTIKYVYNSCGQVSFIYWLYNTKFTFLSSNSSDLLCDATSYQYTHNSPSSIVHPLFISEEQHLETNLYLLMWRSQFYLLTY